MEHHLKYVFDESRMPKAVKPEDINALSAIFVSPSDGKHLKLTEKQLLGLAYNSDEILLRNIGTDGAQIRDALQYFARQHLRSVNIELEAA